MINFVSWYLYSTIKTGGSIIPPTVFDDILFMDGTQIQYMDGSEAEYMS